MPTRRGFMAAAAGVAAAASLTKPAQGNVNNRVRAAVLGVNSRGMTHMEGMEAAENVEVAVLCDPDAEVLGKRAAEFEKKYGHKVETETDLRKVFERKDIDVVSIATPNHWHTLAAIWAMEAGKDVYVEKPGAYSVWEGRQLVNAASHYNRIVQHGVQCRSSEAIREGMEHLHKGTIGQVYMARGQIFKWRPSVNKLPDEAAPAHLNWDVWQGPAAERPFSRRYVHYNWHWHWDFGNGDVGNQGIHETDVCLWGLNVGLPAEITASGGRFLWDDDRQTPETMTATFVYPDQKKMIVLDSRPWCSNSEEGIQCGNIFYGSEGYLVVRGYDQYAIFLGPNREPGPARKSDNETNRHFANFIDAVRTRDKSILHGPVETAHTSSALAHLGNIAYRTGRNLRFDAATETFPGDKEANALLTREYREPYVVRAISV